MSHLVRHHPTHCFKGVRETAIKWEKRKLQANSRAWAYSCDSQVSNSVESNIDANAISVWPSEELKELKECFRKQQAQLDTILQHLSIPQTHNHTRGPKPYQF